MVEGGYNNQEILTNCINSLKEYFDISKRKINQPIIISEIESTLLQVPGVKSVNKVEIINKTGEGYSPFGYDIEGAYRNKILYPSLDPSIFEIRYPDQDIKGRIINF
jgi:hypothetical protein